MVRVVVVFALLYPVQCTSGEFDPVNTCENVMGLTLPGYTYRGDDEVTIYLVPLAGMAFAGFLVWRLMGPRRPPTSRS